MCRPRPESRPGRTSSGRRASGREPRSATEMSSVLAARVRSTDTRERPCPTALAASWPVTSTAPSRSSGCQAPAPPVEQAGTEMPCDADVGRLGGQGKLDLATGAVEGGVAVHKGSSFRGWETGRGGGLPWLSTSTTGSGRPIATIADMPTTFPALPRTATGPAPGGMEARLPGGPCVRCALRRLEYPVAECGAGTGPVLVADSEVACRLGVRRRLNPRGVPDSSTLSG